MREKPKDRGRLLHINEAIANIHNLLTSKARVPDFLLGNQAHALYYLTADLLKSGQNRHRYLKLYRLNRRHTDSKLYGNRC